MSILSESSKLLTNKYFLYFMVFLASTNILGYLVTNKLNAVAFFVLVSIITHQFSKNMAVILLVSVVATNFLMVNKKLREGLETKIPQALDNIENKDIDIAKAIPAVKKLNEKEDIKAVLIKSNNVEEEESDVIDINNEDLNKKTEDETKVVGAGQSMGKIKAKTVSENFGPRLDYAATIEESYNHLDQMLGSDSIQQLTKDTQKLMLQQQNLFNTMNQMVPVLEGAQNMLKGFNMDDLTKSLGDISGLGSAPTAKSKKNTI